MTEDYSEILQQQGIPEHLAEKVAVVLKREIEGGQPRTSEEQAIVSEAWNHYAATAQEDRNV